MCHVSVAQLLVPDSTEDIASGGDGPSNTKAPLRTPEEIKGCVVGILRSDGNPAHLDIGRGELVLLGAFIDGVWQPEEFFALPPGGQPNVQQDRFMGRLLFRDFFGASSSAVLFLPEKKTTLNIIDDRFLGLEGPVTGDFPEEGLSECVMLSRTPTGGRADAASAPSSMSGKFDPLVIEHGTQAVGAFLSADNGMESGKPTAVYRPERHGAPLYKEIADLSLDGGWRGKWVFARLPYPVTQSPPHEYDETQSPWDGLVWILAEESGGKTRAVWIHSECEGDYYSNRFHRLLSVCDMDLDGNPEFVVAVTGHEHRSYHLYTLTHNGLRRISAAVGAL